MISASVGKKTSLTFVQGFRDCLPTLFGYISVGIAFGIVGTASQLTILEITLLSAFVYAGAAQFAICALLLAGSPISAIVFSAFIINLRNFLLSAALAPHFTRESFLHNIGIGIFMTDESFGVATTKLKQSGSLTAEWMHGLNLTAYICWNLSCILGALSGKWIANPETLGLDFALPAMFLGLLFLQLEHVSASKWMLYVILIICMIITMIGLSLLFPAYVAVIIATVIGASLGVVLDK
ncbi:AzlC family ABC transporter permease [Terribacillus sp. 179-K 1B1 HS]|uniref:AzlC family ABC transporter permease n=1 Tax=Terribacillus sp. 179-K 1B1 HS TaxID=3142388 RepID=UPI0039A09F14